MPFALISYLNKFKNFTFIKLVDNIHHHLITFAGSFEEISYSTQKNSGLSVVFDIFWFFGTLTVLKNLKKVVFWYCKNFLQY
jgi:hypothetical protein